MYINWPLSDSNAQQITKVYFHNALGPANPDNDTQNNMGHDNPC